MNSAQRPYSFESPIQSGASKDVRTQLRRVHFPDGTIAYEHLYPDGQTTLVPIQTKDIDPGSMDVVGDVDVSGKPYRQTKTLPAVQQQVDQTFHPLRSLIKNLLAAHE